MFDLRTLWSNRRTATPQRNTTPPSNVLFRPRLEGFEDRTVPAAPVLNAAQVAPAAAGAASLLPINITSVAFNAADGLLSVAGTIGNTVFATTATLTGSQPPSATTPILHLQLNEIHLDVLGLKVDTSKICLDITTTSGPGNLLGNLLGGVANALNGGSPLGSVLGGLSATDLSSVTGGLTDLLNGALGGLGSQSAVSGANSVTNILHLSLGPVDLTLLGLNVSLDNCADGPVTVDISAQAGPGKLLGNLLTSVSHLLDGPANGRALSNALNRVAGEINNLLR